MKYLLTTFLLLLFVQFNSQAQRNTVFQPIQEDDGYTAYQRNVPFEFRFLIDDDLTKVLFNPSNLALIDSNQFYITVEPGNNRNFRFAYLSKKGWVLNGALVSYFNESLSNARSEEMSSSSDTSGNFTFFGSEVVGNMSQSGRENKSNQIDLRFSKLINRSDSKSSSLGLFTRYENNYSKSLDNTFYEKEELEQEFRNDTLIELSTALVTRENLSTSDYGSNKVLLGIEYSSRSGNTNIIHSIYGQYNDAENTGNFTRFDILDVERDFFEQNLSDDTYRRTERNSRNEYLYSPWLIGYNGYINKEINWLGADYIFTSLHSVYGWDKLSLSSKELQESFTISNGVQNTSTARDIDFKNGDLNEYYVSANLSFGYATKIEFDDFYFFSGLKNRFLYLLQNGFKEYNSYLIINEDYTLKEYQAQIPLFGEYSINNWISFFGGSNMFFTYRSSIIKQKPEFVIEDNANDETRMINQRNTGSSFDTNTTTYFGLKAHHKSRLRFIADINGDLARLSGWRFTLGYQF